MNEERRHDFHMELWNWLAENPEAEKSNWPGWNCEEVESATMQSEHLDAYHCFACMVRDGLIEQEKCGDVCPVQWSLSLRCNDLYSPCCPNSRDSMYRAWENESFQFRTLEDEIPSLEKRRALAIQIAEAWGTNTGAR